jgi:hypothetical protein
VIKFIPAEEQEELFQEWRKDPKYVAAYDALADEFALAEALGSSDMPVRWSFDTYGRTPGKVPKCRICGR